MSTITAAELKQRGVSALAPALSDDREAIITVRGKPLYAVMKIETYDEFREAELANAVREVRADYKAGRIVDDTVEGHLKSISKDTAADAV